MNRHLLAALFLVGCLMLTVPLLLIQHSGVANASVTAGFMLPLDNKLHGICLLVIGGLAAWLAREMLVLLPISGLLMLVLGMLSIIDLRIFPEAKMFTVGTILLFSMTVSMMRRPLALVAVPVAVWAYFTGDDYMQALPAGIQPLFFLLGATVSAAFLVAIGVAFGVTVSGMIRGVTSKLKTISVIALLLTIF